MARAPKKKAARKAARAKPIKKVKSKSPAPKKPAAKKIPAKRKKPAPRAKRAVAKRVKTAKKRTKKVIEKRVKKAAQPAQKRPKKASAKTTKKTAPKPQKAAKAAPTRRVKERVKKPTAAPPKPRAKTKAPEKPFKPTALELRALARRPWKDLSKVEQAALRSWRAKKAAKTRSANYYAELASRLNGELGREERDAAREEVKESGGTRGLARYLKRVRRWDEDDIESAFAFWFYSE